MLHDIFKKIKKVIKNRQKSIPKIIADIHEKNSLVIPELYNSKIKPEIKALKIADYLIGDIAIERKTVQDLISSMINKRLVEQLKQLKKYNQQILIVEGDIQEVLKENSNISKAVRGLILSIITNYRIPIIFTKDYEDTAKYLIAITKQQTKPKTTISLHSRIPKTISEQKSYILEAFPNIGPKKAQKLLKKFKTIKNTINASEEGLKEILKSKAEDFKRISES